MAERDSLLPLRSILCAALLGGVASRAAGQEVLLQLGPGPHRIGEEIELVVVAEGFPGGVMPRASFEAPPFGALALRDTTPSTRTRVATVDGERRRLRSVSYAYRFIYSSARPGKVSLGPFAVEQGKTRRLSRKVEIELRDVPASADLRLQLTVPPGRVYLGQRVPVELEFWIARELREPLQSYSLRVPLFDLPGLHFIDDHSGTDTDLRIQTAKGPLDLRGVSRDEMIEGRAFVAVSLRRTLVARQTGQFEAEPAIAIISRVTKWRRDRFGSREAVAGRRLKAVGEPLRFEVAEIPVAGAARASFAGAVGGEYTLRVSADRSVVQVGEPVVLHFSLRGNGDLVAAGLPSLDAAGLLDADRFRAPAEPPPGRMERGEKHFEAVVRVLDEEVEEIPALEYAWFDPVGGRYETTHTEPIALAVRGARVIGAAEVERRGARSGRPKDDARPPFLAVDLWMERDAALLLRDERTPRTGRAAVAGLYGLGCLAVASAWWLRRHGLRDPWAQERRVAVAAARRDVERAIALPEREAADALARALREMRKRAPEGSRPELDLLLGECDARSYAPKHYGTRPSHLPEELRARARSLADQLAAEGRARSTDERRGGPTTSG